MKQKIEPQVASAERKNHGFSLLLLITLGLFVFAALGFWGSPYFAARVYLLCLELGPEQLRPWAFEGLDETGPEAAGSLASGLLSETPQVRARCQDLLGELVAINQTSRYVATETERHALQGRWQTKPLSKAPHWYRADATLRLARMRSTLAHIARSSPQRAHAIGVVIRSRGLCDDLDELGRMRATADSYRELVGVLGLGVPRRPDRPGHAEAPELELQIFWMGFGGLPEALELARSLIENSQADTKGRKPYGREVWRETIPGK